MTLYRYNGALLRVDGALAAAAACCCDEGTGSGSGSSCNCTDDAGSVRVSVRIVTNNGTFDQELTQQDGSTWGDTCNFTLEHGITAATEPAQFWAEAVCTGSSLLAADLYCSNGGAFIHTGSANDFAPPSCGDVESFNPGDINTACGTSYLIADTINVEFCATCDGSDPAALHSI